MPRLVFAALFTALLASGCANSHGTSPDASAASAPRSCDIAAGSVHICTEYSHALGSEEVARNACEHPAAPDGGPSVNGVWSDTPCSDAGAVGGCQITSASITITTWYYGTLNADTLRSGCEMGGGAWVAP